MRSGMAGTAFSTAVAHIRTASTSLLALLNRLERRVLRGAPEVVAGSGSHESSWFAFVCLV